MVINEQFRAIAKRYCGMTPNEVGCANWIEMWQKMADELEAVVNSHISLPDINAKSELLLSYFKWHEEQGYVSHKYADIDEFLKYN